MDVINYNPDFFILVKVEDLAINIEPKSIPEFIRYARLIVAEVNKEIKVVHPEEQSVANVRLVHFYGPPTNSKADSKTLIVGSRDNVDRSPCGTGTSARMAALYAQGKLELGETFCTESIIGTIFHGKVLEEKKVGEFLAIVPQITGSAYITGFHQFIIESSDPLKHGFSL